MSTRKTNSSLSRRRLLKGAALAGTAAVGTPLTGRAQDAPRPSGPTTPAPNPAMESGHGPDRPIIQSTSGSDYMADVIKSLGIEHVACNPGTSFRGLHESLINYLKIDWHTCTHEEASVAMANGFAKIEGKPLLTLAHGTVGLQHASMALYNAWCDRVPIYMMVGNTVDATKRAPGGEWFHSVQDAGAMVRDFMKWDDQPASLTHFGESAVRAYKIATTPPMGPVFLSLDAELQENPVPDAESLRIPKFQPVIPPQGDAAAIAEAAKMLVEAQNPIIVCDRVARTPAGMANLVALAEALQCGVIDNAGRMNFPSRHPLNQSFRRALIGQADVILALEMNDLRGTLTHFHDRIVRTSSPSTKAGAKIITLGVRYLYLKSNYQDFGRWQDVDLDIAGDGEASLPALTEAVKRLVDDGRKSAFGARGEKLAKLHMAMVEQSKSDATIGWDSSPITTARMCAEVYDQIKDEDWSLVGTAIRLTWPHRLWDFNKPYQWNGVSGGAGVGYNLPASLGAALANKRHGRFTLAFGGDGDFMFVPSTLWTAAHHRIPMLYILHNNRAYHQEYMYLQAMAARHGRGITNTDIGTTIKDPNVDYATVARGFGVYGEGPISDPNELGPALKRAVAMVKSGQPALVDVVTDPR